MVTETIEIIAEGVEIRRGIFRDLPRFYEAGGQRLAYDYDVLEVQRDGHGEPYDTSTEGNALRIRIGEEDTLLKHGAHVYVIRYRVKNQVRYFDAYDEVYWNATGNYWAFPIARARATIVLPAGAHVTAAHGYSGALGETGNAYRYRQDGDRHVFETTQALRQEEGMSVAVGFEKGLIDPPSGADRGMIWWQRNGALAILLASLGGLFWFLYRAYDRVGRDPVKGPVFPRYEAPTGLSPAAVHHIFSRSTIGHRALIATLMNLAVNGRLDIEASDNETVLRRRIGVSDTAPRFTEEDQALERGVFAGAEEKVLGGKPDETFASVYSVFRERLGKKYGALYFRWNAGYTLAAIALSILVIVICAVLIVQWTIWHTLGVAALAAMNIAFMYFMPAPTAKGQEIHTEIEGFKLYMEAAEKLQLNAVQPGVATPPPMTTERYERFLPYAVALGVEKPWTQHFERLIPEAAAAYNPGWTNLNSGGASRSLNTLSGALIANMSSGVSSALPQSSSSSGSGGGGSSGGGGGGGGGGGW